MKKISFRSIQRELSACAFHPDRPGPLKIITEIDNPSYYIQRSIEFLHEARDMIDNLEDNPKLLEQYNDKLIKSIQLIILAKEYINE